MFNWNSEVYFVGFHIQLGNKQFLLKVKKKKKVENI